MSLVSRRSSRSAPRVFLAVMLVFGLIIGPTGALAVTPTTMDSPLASKLASVSSGGTLGDDWSDEPAMSDSGRYVVFESRASNLVPGGYQGDKNVFWRDTKNRVTKLVSGVPDDALAADRGSRAPSVSDDGRYVSFITGKDHLPTDTNAGEGDEGVDVYVKDMQTDEFVYCDITQDGMGFSGDSNLYQFISGNGRYIVIGLHEAIDPDDDNGYRDVYRYDIASDETTLVSPIDTLDYWYYGAKPIGISDDGRYVAFVTRRAIVAEDQNGSGYDYYRKDLTTGEIDLVAFNGGTSSADANWPEDGEVSLSGTGRYLVFETYMDLVAEDMNGGGYKDIYRYDFDEEEFMLITPMLEDMEEAYRGARSGSISDDGMKIAFFTGRDFVPWDTNDDQDMYYYDVATGMYTYMDLMGNGMSPGDDPENIVISGDGSSVAYETDEAIIPSDINDEEDIYVRPLSFDIEDGGFRVAGDDRYETSVEISKLGFPSGADTVVIATGANWPDALCGSALAGAVDGPVLLAAPGGLSDAVKAEIMRLGATDAYVLGDQKAVSVKTEAQLDAMLSGYVTRISGRDRYWTAKAITNKVIELRPDMYDGKALVTTGGNYADAMSAAPLSAALAWPVLLVNPNTNSVYKPADLAEAVILGGGTAVPAIVESDLEDLLGEDNVMRLAGNNRYETAAKIAQYGVDSGMHWDGVGVAVGTNFPDALAGGAVLGRLGAVVLLTPSNTLAPAAATKLTDNAGDINSVHILGGPAAVSTTVKNHILSILGL